MTLSASELLRRYVHHVLPHGFVRVRQFGSLVNRRVSEGIAASTGCMLPSHSTTAELGRSLQALVALSSLGHIMQTEQRLTALGLYSFCARLDLILLKNAQQICWNIEGRTKRTAPQLFRADRFWMAPIRTNGHRSKRQGHLREQRS